MPCFFTIYKFGKSFISIQKFECIIITLCVKTCGIPAKEKNNYVFSCIEYLQSMKPCVEPIKKKKKLDCFYQSCEGERMSTLQHDEAMIQALAITKAQAGVRSMSAEEIVTYINDLVRAIRSTLDKNTEDDGQAEEKVDTEGLDPRKSIRENSVTCLECGQKFKMITKRHLRIHNLTPEEYKEKWGFRKNSSLACKSLQRMRRQKMKDMHIWDRRKNARKDDSAGGEGDE